MKVSARNWQPQTANSLYRAAGAREGAGRLDKNGGATPLQEDPGQTGLSDGQVRGQDQPGQEPLVPGRIG